MEISESKINNVGVEVLKNKEEFTKANVKGWDYLPMPYSNVCICSKKNSGKTTIIYNLVKNCIDNRTRVMIFSGSVSKDNAYKNIIKYCKEKGISVESYSHFKEDGVNIVEQLLNVVCKPEKKGKDTEEEENRILFDEDGQRPKRQKKKKLVPEILLIFDDLGTLLRDQTISRCCKLNRHPKIMNLISFHHDSDVLPATTTQSDFVFLFGGYPEEKLEKLYNKLVLNVSYDDFLKLYLHATKKKYDFLMIDVRNNKYRRNFNFELSL